MQTRTDVFVLWIVSLLSDFWLPFRRTRYRRWARLPGSEQVREFHLLSRQPPGNLTFSSLFEMKTCKTFGNVPMSFFCWFSGCYSLISQNVLLFHSDAETNLRRLKNSFTCRSAPSVIHRSGFIWDFCTDAQIKTLRLFHSWSIC